jgi:CheY-like chemotaxis protein
MLGGAGYEIMTAADGEEALKIFDREGDRIRLCITDVVMPGIDGIKLSRELKEKYPLLKIVAVSGYSLGVDRKELEEAGVVDWIQKPFQSRAIMEAVRKALETGEGDGR